MIPKITRSPEKVAPIDEYLERVRRFVIQEIRPEIVSVHVLFPGIQHLISEKGPLDMTFN